MTQGTQVPPTAPRDDTAEAVDALIDALRRDDEAVGMEAIRRLLKTLLGDLRRVTLAIEKLAGHVP